MKTKKIFINTVKRIEIEEYLEGNIVDRVLFIKTDKRDYQITLSGDIESMAVEETTLTI